MRLVLASASPRRAELLTAAGFTFEVHVTDVDERTRADERPHAYVRRLAIEKSERVLERLAGRPEAALDFGDVGLLDAGQRTSDPGAGVLVLGADTAVILGNEILGKPVDPDDAERMLRLLSGRSHVVLTGVSLRSARSQVDVVEETTVFFAELSDQQVAWYISSGEGKDKAGAYAIQGLASRFIPRIEGSYSNVVGLPVARVAELIGRLE